MYQAPLLSCWLQSLSSIAPFPGTLGGRRRDGMEQGHKITRGTIGVVWLALVLLPTQSRAVQVSYSLSSASGKTALDLASAGETDSHAIAAVR